MSTIHLESRICPGCGAAMPPIPPQAEQVSCDYCGRSFTVVQGQSPAEPLPVGRPPERSRGSAALTAVFVVVMIAVTTLPISVILGVVAIQDGLHHELGIDLGALIGQPSGSTATLRWVDQYAAPALADVDGDGRLDLLALHRRRGDPDDRSWLGAYSGHDLREVWLYGPIQGDPVREVGALVLGDRVVVQEPHGLVSVLSLASGERLAQLQLPENPSWARLCAAEESGTMALIHDVAVLDVASLTLAEGSARARRSWPEHCRVRRMATNTTENGDTFAWAVSARSATLRTGLKVERVLREGAHQLVLAAPKRGKAQPLLIGESAESGEEQWRLPLTVLAGSEEEVEVRGLDLGEGVAYVAYSTDFHDASRIAFIDAGTGEVLVRGSLRGRYGDTVAFGDGRAFIVDYVGLDTRVVIYDVRTGPAIDSSTQGPLVFGRP